MSLALNSVYRRRLIRDGAELLRLAGWTNEEIATLACCTTRTVQRSLARKRRARKRMKASRSRERPTIEDRIPDGGCSGAELAALLAKFDA